jgi:hypothetical protein
MWLKIFGVPKLIVSDSEGALGSEEAAIWAERLGTSFKLLPRGITCKHCGTSSRNTQTVDTQNPSSTQERRNHSFHS